METKLTIFKNETFGAIRTAGTSDEPLFCLADICRVLDLQASRVKDRLNQDGVILNKVIDNLGREQNATFITELNLYRVIMRSDKPQAEAFQDWVCGEVLPSIRKTGGYMAEVPTSFKDALLLAAKQQEEIERQQALLIAQGEQVQELTCEVEEMREKVSYLDTILNCKSTVLVTQIAQDYGMSAKVFNKKLEEMKIQHKVHDQWILFGKYLAAGYVHSRAVDIIHANGQRTIKYNTEWTQKGRLFLYDALKAQGILPLIER